ncbi:uncharacterized protein F5Z01DRAFT_462106 [Emericellopsis atlantica]|uniref:DUF1295-domain-containing protein n=1 Tax=Emericellopsis atlantica TaxID=2614577 RepID=A0A9P8CRY6_9HYPO|nr:uncharacterized protein F5Z01DRAFT_462106 [Emericellopsis atlantica]KAG9257278.1 hypothetical protein F5Z01DRAFT_462106 [Emericellopsis atlantica]
MALPLLKTLKECGEYAKTVEPFWPQLYELPYKLLNSYHSLDRLKQLYIDTNPLMSGLAASLFLAPIFLIVSEINRNYSQVDRMWSILPNLYVVHIALWARAAGMPHERIDLAAITTTIWSIRLTFNYWRRGGYEKGSEDYRWAILQKYVPKFIWFIFNVTFISSIQSVLLFAFSCVPAYGILLATKFEPGLQTSDFVYSGIMMALVVSELISDGQQWSYQTAKYQYRDDGKVRGGFTKKDLERGFRTSGLWAYSRHPNFFAEQMVWFALYQWSCYATNNVYSYTGLGAGSLCLLFQGSTLLTEYITQNKYPEYKEYQKQVGMFFPSFTAYQPPKQQIKGKGQ